MPQKQQFVSPFDTHESKVTYFHGNKIVNKSYILEYVVIFYDVMQNNSLLSYYFTNYDQQLQFSLIK